MGAGMSDQIGDAQNLAALQLVDKRHHRAHPQRRVRRAEIEQVGIVRDDFGDAGFLAIDDKLFDLFFAVWFRRPLARRLGKNLDRIAVDFLAVEQRVADAAGDRHVSAQ